MRPVKTLDAHSTYGTEEEFPLKIACLSLTISVTLLCATPRDWKTGKVMDASSAKEYVQTGIAPGGQIDITKSRSTDLVIVGDQYAYTVEDTVQKATGLPTRGFAARAIANRKHGCRFIVGDSVQYAQSKNDLYVKDADGKECKTEILRQERIGK